MRVFLTGPTGSGKSTLARRIADRFALPLHALDDMHWESFPDGDRRRDPAARAAMLAQVVRHDAWLVEGVQFKWADSALERAELIVVLDLPRWRNRLRILRRFAGRRLSGRPGPRGTLAALRQEFGWSHDYYGYERAMLFDKLEPWRDKVRVAGDSAMALAMIAQAARNLSP